MDNIYKRTEIELAERKNFIKELLIQKGYNLKDIEPVMWRSTFVLAKRHSVYRREYNNKGRLKKIKKEVDILYDANDLDAHALSGTEAVIPTYVGHSNSWYKLIK